MDQILTRSMTVTRRAQGQWALVLATALWAGWRLLAESDGGLGLPEAVCAMLAAAIVGVVTLALGLQVVRAMRRDRTPFGVAASWPIRLHLGLVLMVVVLTQAHVPLTVRVALSAPALEQAARVARATRTGLPRDPSRRIGWFLVEEVIVSGDEVRFGTAACGLDFCGVVQRARGAPVRSGAITYSPVYGEWWRWHERW